MPRGAFGRALTIDERKAVPPNDPRLANLPACSAFDVNFATRTSTCFVPRGAVWSSEKRSPKEVR
jgi:hypothetical protein